MNTGQTQESDASGRGINPFLGAARILGARTEKLTKGLFLALPPGSYIVSNLIGQYEAVAGPVAERESQWSSVPQGVRHRFCRIYNSKEYYDRNKSCMSAPRSRPKEVPRLNRKLFLSLPAGAFVAGRSRQCVEVTHLDSEREQQWRTVPEAMRNRPCRVYESKAQYDSEMQQLLEAFPSLNDTCQRPTNV